MKRVYRVHARAKNYEHTLCHRSFETSVSTADDLQVDCHVCRVVLMRTGRLPKDAPRDPASLRKPAELAPK